MGLTTNDEDYDVYIAHMRKTEYPMLGGAVYLDHAGTSLPNKTTLDAFHRDMLDNLYANPHSASISSQRTSQEVEEVRLRLLRYFGADPDSFDVVFTANATAGIKLVVEALREQPGGYDYAYHVDSHTSVVGMRELASEARCISSQQELTEWKETMSSSSERFFAYPAQSNMTSHCHSLSWCADLRKAGIKTLLDAASYASTKQLDLDAIRPDFTIVSLSKIFGFPDLGLLIVHKEAAYLFDKRRYFGGGTVDMVICKKEQWHIKRTSTVHEQLEDGSLQIRNIIALKSAMITHATLFGSLDRIARHTTYLTKRLREGLQQLRHGNDRPVSVIYTSSESEGPVLAFNFKDEHGQWVSNAEVEKAAAIQDVHLRTGTVCNPGGTAEVLELEPWEMRQNLAAGFRCGGGSDVFNEKSTGVVRVSLGAMSTSGDVDRFLSFVKDYFVSSEVVMPEKKPSSLAIDTLQVESLIVYPIKSCAGWTVPSDMTWEIRPEGLNWDREWCIVHQGTGAALSQKRHPRMALIRPHLNFKTGQLRISLPASTQPLIVPLSMDPSSLEQQGLRTALAQVCDDKIRARRYVSADIEDKLSTFLGVACTLARFPPTSSSRVSVRHRKDHLSSSRVDSPIPLLLSNESPILTITRSSLNALNETLKAHGNRAAHHSVFRANIILIESPQQRPGRERPWVEDHWETMTIHRDDSPTVLKNLGGCRRCQMVCVDQLTAEKRPEIFLTLAKQRRIGGKVLFGIHSTLHASSHGSVRVGDRVEVS